jgi:hypothetical protein
VSDGLLSWRPSSYCAHASRVLCAPQRRSWVRQCLRQLLHNLVEGHGRGEDRRSPQTAIATLCTVCRSPCVAHARMTLTFTASQGERLSPGRVWQRGTRSRQRAIESTGGPQLADTADHPVSVTRTCPHRQHTALALTIEQLYGMSFDELYKAVCTNFTVAGRGSDRITGPGRLLASFTGTPSLTTIYILLSVYGSLYHERHHRGGTRIRARGPRGDGPGSAGARRTGKQVEHLRARLCRGPAGRHAGEADAVRGGQGVTLADIPPKRAHRVPGTRSVLRGRSRGLRLRRSY